MKNFLKVTLLAATMMTAPVSPIILPSFAAEETDLLTDILDEARSILTELGLLVSEAENKTSLLTDIDGKNSVIVDNTETIKLDTTQQLEAVTGPTANIPHDGAYTSFVGSNTNSIYQNLDSFNGGTYSGDANLTASVFDYSELAGLGYIEEIAETDRSRASLVIATRSGVFGAAVADVGYQQAAQSNERLSSYMDNLKNSGNIKESIDLNSRILLELVHQTNELLKINSVQLSAFGVKEGSESLKFLDNYTSKTLNKYNR